MGVAGRYVKSLLVLAQEQNALEAVHADMQQFSRVVNENNDFRLMLKNPIIRHEKKREILIKMFTGRVHPLTLAIFDILTRKNRESILAAIATEFHREYNRVVGTTTASLTVASPLSASNRKEISDLVSRISNGNKVELLEKIDPELIGGFVLKVGDRQVDASVKSRLTALRHMFSQNPYIKEY